MGWISIQSKSKVVTKRVKAEAFIYTRQICSIKITKLKIDNIGAVNRTPILCVLCPPPAPLGDGQTPSLTVMLANVKF